MSQDQPRNNMELRHQQRDARNAQVQNLSPEEAAIMEECRRESFYYRALPLGLAFGVGMQAAIQTGKVMAVGNVGKIFDQLSR